MLTKCIEKKLDGIYTRVLHTVLNKSCKQHPKKQQLYSHLPPIAKTIHIWWTRWAGHYSRRKDELPSNILPWIPTHGYTSVGQAARTYLHQLCVDTGCSLEDLPRVMDGRANLMMMISVVFFKLLTFKEGDGFLIWYIFFYSSYIWQHIMSSSLFIFVVCPVNWGWRIHWLFPCRG